jgi:radical SAM protein with 4Fe4S-binding SPASM domain
MKQLKELNVAGPATKHDFFIQWHLTERCNLRCRHCYQPERAMQEELSLEEAREVVEEAAEMLGDWAETHGVEFSPSFNVTGGEPFLRRDLLEVIEALRGRAFDVFLLTNGTLVTRERAEALASLGVKAVQVSVEGPREVHDSIRGRGSFNAAMRGVRRLLEAGLTVTLNVTLSALNARSMGDIIALALTVGAQRVGFSRLVPAGRGLGLVSEGLSPGHLKELYGSLLSQRIKGLDIVTGDPVAAQMNGNVPRAADAEPGCTAVGGCAAGLAGLTLLPDGTITPCRRLHIPIGNVRHDSMREVWATSEVLWSLRDKGGYKGRCGRCPRWDSCRGCRAIAYAYSAAGGGEGDFLAEDPQCFIFDGGPVPGSS